MRTAHIITAGKHEPNIKELIDTYSRRLQASWRIEWHICKTADQSEENRYFQSQLVGKRYIALDETGTNISSIAFSDLLEQSAVDGHNELYFLIGGSFGLDEALLKHAWLVWSFGAITLPHQFARLILVEQLYRAQSILSGSNYHH